MPPLARAARRRAHVAAVLGLCAATMPPAAGQAYTTLGKGPCVDSAGNDNPRYCYPPGKTERGACKSFCSSSPDCMAFYHGANGDGASSCRIYTRSATGCPDTGGNIGWGNTGDGGQAVGEMVGVTQGDGTGICARKDAGTCRQGVGTTARGTGVGV